MEKLYNVAIVGGGFSGLCLATELSKNNISTIVFEKLDRVGKKILVTGNGRGNVSNENLSIDYYHGEKGFILPAITKYGLNEMKSFFLEKGLMLSSENGKVFPSSFQANAILDSLRNAISSNCVNVTVQNKVESIEKIGGVFIIKTANDEYKAEKVVIAFGGASQKNLGTDGLSYSLLSPFGHTKTKLFPVLTQMLAEGYASLKGVKVDAVVTLNSDKQKINKIRGDLLFTANGISGNTIFYLSSYLPMLAEPNLDVELVPDVKFDELINTLNIRKNIYSNQNVSDILSGIVQNALGRFIVKNTLNKKYVYELSDSDIKLLANSVKHFKIKVKLNNNFDISQVTRGGIDTKSVNSNNFESKMVSGLFIIGEALNVDGDCGGYNLAWAFASAMCVRDELCKG